MLVYQTVDEVRGYWGLILIDAVLKRVDASPTNDAIGKRKLSCNGV
mgnify:FL=1